MINLWNKSSITKAMDKIFLERRRFLLEKIQEIEDFKYQYPLLFCYDQVFLNWFFGIVNTNIANVQVRVAFNQRRWNLWHFPKPWKKYDLKRKKCWV